MLYLPDSQRGYYRATRFDWSGVIAGLSYKGHEYFGQWFDKYDPKLHDAIMGPVEEFQTGATALGYDQAKPGGAFIRIGVGVLRKPEAPSSSASTPTRLSTEASGTFAPMRTASSSDRFSKPNPQAMHPNTGKLCA